MHYKYLIVNPYVMDLPSTESPTLLIMLFYDSSFNSDGSNYHRIYSYDKMQFYNVQIDFW